MYQEVMTFGTNKKWPYKTGDLLKKGKIYKKYSMTGQQKGDLLI